MLYAALPKWGDSFVYRISHSSICIKLGNLTNDNYLLLTSIVIGKNNAHIAIF